MKNKLRFYFLLIFILVPIKTYAFLPPEFFVQGISSVVSVIAGGIAVAVIPMLIFIKFTKNFFNKHKKLIIIIVIQNITIAAVLGVFFYYKYYKPLYEDSYLFPKAELSDVDPLDKTIESYNLADPKNFNKNYTISENIIRDEKEVVINHDYGIDPEEINEKIDAKIKIYYLDIREVEEFNVGHVLGAKQIRAADIKDADMIKSNLELNEEELKNSLIVVYCHDGERSLYVAKNLNKSNIKYLIGGVQWLGNNKYIEYTGDHLSDKKIFGDDYQKDFQILSQKASEMIENRQDTFVIDMRLGRVFAEEHLKESLHFLYNTMTTEEYENRLAKILENKDKNIIFIADRYSELFYANLLIMRLEKKYQFDRQKFHILFNQFQALKNNSSLEFDAGYPQI